MKIGWIFELESSSWELGKQWLTALESLATSVWGQLAALALLLVVWMLWDWFTRGRQGWAVVAFRLARWFGRVLKAVLVGLFLEVAQDEIGNWDDD